ALQLELFHVRDLATLSGLGLQQEMAALSSHHPVYDLLTVRRHLRPKRSERHAQQVVLGENFFFARLQIPHHQLTIGAGREPAVGEGLSIARDSKMADAIGYWSGFGIG